MRENPCAFSKLLIFNLRARQKVLSSKLLVSQSDLQFSSIYRHHQSKQFYRLKSSRKMRNTFFFSLVSVEREFSLCFFKCSLSIFAIYSSPPHSHTPTVQGSSAYKNILEISQTHFKLNLKIIQKYRMWLEFM